MMHLAASRQDAHLVVDAIKAVRLAAAQTGSLRPQPPQFSRPFMQVGCGCACGSSALRWDLAPARRGHLLQDAA
jgi:hypothetical protein